MGEMEGGEVTTSKRPAMLFAGCPADMERFLRSNAGLDRRITKKIFSQDYSAEEITGIFLLMVKKRVLAGLY